VTTIEPHVGLHQPLSRRARFDIATLITAGVASTLFFLLPVWVSVGRSTRSSGGDVTRLATAQPAVDSAVATVSLYAPPDAPSAAPTPRRALLSAPRARRGPQQRSFKCRRKRSRHNPGSLDFCWETAANQCGRSRSRVVDRSPNRVARETGASRTPWRAAVPAASHRRSR